MGVQSKMVAGALPTWVGAFASHLSIYAGVFVGGAALVQLVRRVPALARSRPGRFFCFDSPLAPEGQPEPQPGGKESAAPSTGGLIFAAAGIFTTLIAQGVFQERLMTGEYATGAFTWSGYAILYTRVLGFLVAQAVLMAQSMSAGRGLLGVAPHRAAFHKFSYISLSNVVSSWCQYESLKHTSFPVTTLAKSAKTIPVMAMGRLLHGRRNSWEDYGSALIVVAGVSGYAFSTGGGGGGAAATTSGSGVVLLSLYLFFDAFQSQWQGGLFKKEKVSQLEMMRGAPHPPRRSRLPLCLPYPAVPIGPVLGPGLGLGSEQRCSVLVARTAGVNAAASILSLITLGWTGELLPPTAFVLRNPECLLHLGGLALTGTLGQLFIYYTISNFGPVRKTFRSGISSASACPLLVVN